MKCIRCEKDCKLNERRDGRCPHCGGKFALEPRSGDKLSDGFFQSAVKAVSSDGQVRWHLENLYYEVCRRKQAPGCAGYDRGCLALVVLFMVGGHLLEGIAEVLVLGGGAAVIAAVTRSLSDTVYRPRLFSRETFNSEWSRWAETHGTPASMIRPAVTVGIEARQAVESDLADYSFDRAVICDRPETVDLLVANNFHFENNCAVLSADGYPQQAFAAVRKMLRHNPRLKVWVLHDATPSGCALAHQLQADPEWFSEGTVVIDAGLRPAQAKPLEKLWEPALPTKVNLRGPGFTAEEANWLERYRLSLAAIRPEQVIKRLFRSVSTDVSDYAMIGGVYVDNASFSAHADTSDGGGDSFG